MGDKPVFMVGLKAICGQCEKEFSATAKQQRVLFQDESLPCPACQSMQRLPKDQQQALTAQGNPGGAYRVYVGIMGIAGMAFFGSVLAGFIQSDGVVMLGIVLAIGGQLAVSMGFKSATSGLVARLIGSDPSHCPSVKRL